MEKLEQIIAKHFNLDIDEIGIHYSSYRSISLRDIIDIAIKFSDFNIDQAADIAGVKRTLEPPRGQKYMINKDDSFYSVNRETILSLKYNKS